MTVLHLLAKKYDAYYERHGEPPKILRLGPKRMEEFRQQFPSDIGLHTFRGVEVSEIKGGKQIL